jgi:hypothetical protein
LIVNLGAWRAFFRERLERQAAITGDDELGALLEEIAGYPELPSESDGPSDPGPGETPGPLRLRGPGGLELSFLGMFATFDAPFEVTTSELAIELLFPADRATAEALESMARRAL